MPHPTFVRLVARRAVPALAACLLLVACVMVRPLSAQATASVAHAPWTRSASIYEINVRQFSPEGTLAAVTRELPRLRALGVDILWLMPVQPIGKANRKGSLGSYYSIADYVAVNPEFGTLADFRALVDRAHALGMRVILDWVANHTAFDHPWITAHPDWYVHRPDGSISVAIDDKGKETDWTDVAQLDYRNAQLREGMIAAMEWWVRETRIDGFRCDVAFFIPTDFWLAARPRLARIRPSLFLLAEAEVPELHAAFDATYAWTLHHLLNDVAKRTKPVSELQAWLATEARRFPADAYRMAFTSNHDENSWNGSEFERMGANHRPAFVLAATLRGTIPLVYTGQELGNRKRLRFFDKDTVESREPALAAWYTQVLALKRRNAALANGDAGGAHVPLAVEGAPDVFAFSRTRGTNSVVVAVNMGDAAATLRYRGFAAPGRYRDWFGGEATTLAAAGTFTVPAHGVRVFVRGAR
ncbi:MAG: alpha-amylase family glycosyl hydrolase [Gemmatimonadaceae bacterium]|nr:alpha-amylase family glycosyl hydrolase [Gemmatimonadaceae bacterium]